jgi:elongator complex protein 1
VTTTLYKPVGVGGDVSIASTEKPAEKVNRICEAIRQDLERRNADFYANSILTAHVCKRPSEYASALRLLVRLRGPVSDNICRRDIARGRLISFRGRNTEFGQERVEDAVKYIIFLSDANKLFDVALGIYDFGLTLLIGQYSQKVCGHLSRSLGTDILCGPDHDVWWVE